MNHTQRSREVDLKRSIPVTLVLLLIIGVVACELKGPIPKIHFSTETVMSITSTATQFDTPTSTAQFCQTNCVSYTQTPTSRSKDGGNTVSTSTATSTSLPHLTLTTVTRLTLTPVPKLTLTPPPLVTLTSPHQITLTPNHNPTSTCPPKKNGRPDKKC